MLRIRLGRCNAAREVGEIPPVRSDMGRYQASSCHVRVCALFCDHSVIWAVFAAPSDVRFLSFHACRLPRTPWWTHYVLHRTESEPHCYTFTARLMEAMDQNGPIAFTEIEVQDFKSCIRRTIRHAFRRTSHTYMCELHWLPMQVTRSAGPRVCFGLTCCISVESVVKHSF